MKGGFQPRAIGVKDKNGNMLMNERQVQQRWTEHFTELLNRESPINNIAEDGPVAGYTESEEEIPTRGEVQAAIKALKNNKAPGMDMLNPEILKADNDILLTELVELFGAGMDSRGHP